MNENENDEYFVSNSVEINAENVKVKFLCTREIKSEGHIIEEQLNLFIQKIDYFLSYRLSGCYGGYFSTAINTCEYFEADSRCDGLSGDIYVRDQNLTTICSSYKFKKIGDANYANISNLYLDIVVLGGGLYSTKLIEIDFAEICISISYLSSVASTNAFNSAWENAKNDLYIEMSKKSSLLNNIAAKNAFKSYLLSNLQSQQAKSSLSTFPCGNDVPTTPAKFCLIQ